MAWRKKKVEKKRKKERGLECRVAMPPPRPTRDKKTRSKSKRTVQEIHRKAQSQLIPSKIETVFEETSILVLCPAIKNGGNVRV